MRVVFLIVSFAQLVFAATEPVLFHSINSFNHPESVLVEQNTLWISDMGQNPSEVENADGNLVKYNLSGDLDQTFTLKTKLNSPMGMAIIKDTIYLADINRVVGVNKNSGELDQVFDLSFSSSVFLNDIVAIEDQYLIVTATDIKKIYLISLNQNKVEELNIDFHGYTPNGVFYEKQTHILYFASNEKHALGQEGNGKVSKYLFENKKATFQQEFSVGKFLDGVFVKEDQIVVSDWQSAGNDGKIYILDKSSIVLSHEFSLKTSGLADMDYSEKNKVLVTPDFIQGIVRLYKFQ